MAGGFIQSALQQARSGWIGRVFGFGARETREKIGAAAATSAAEKGLGHEQQIEAAVKAASKVSWWERATYGAATVAAGLFGYKEYYEAQASPEVQDGAAAKGAAETIDPQAILRANHMTADQMGEALNSGHPVLGLDGKPLEAASLETFTKQLTAQAGFRANQVTANLAPYRQGLETAGVGAQLISNAFTALSTLASYAFMSFIGRYVLDWMRDSGYIGQDSMLGKIAGWLDKTWDKMTGTGTAAGPDGNKTATTFTANDGSGAAPHIQTLSVAANNQATAPAPAPTPAVVAAKVEPAAPVVPPVVNPYDNAAAATYEALGDVPHMKSPSIVPDHHVDAPAAAKPTSVRIISLSTADAPQPRGSVSSLKNEHAEKTAASANSSDLLPSGEQKGKPLADKVFSRTPGMFGSLMDGPPGH